MENKTIKTPFKGFKVEIKNWLNAEDEFEIQKVMWNKAEMSGGTVTDVKGEKGDIMIEMEKTLMERAVIKIDDEARDIWQRLLKMPSEDYDFIKIEVDKMRDYEQVKKN